MEGLDGGPSGLHPELEVLPVAFEVSRRLEEGVRAAFEVSRRLVENLDAAFEARLLQVTNLDVAFEALDVTGEAL